jgi:hypothetical protein
MKTVTIPTCANPFVVIVNGIKYTYPAGATVEVPDDVAEVIEQHEEAKPEPAPVAPPFASVPSEGDTIPTFDLVAMGLPVLAFSAGATSNLEVDTTDIKAALDKGLVRFIAALEGVGNFEFTPPVFHGDGVYQMISSFYGGNIMNMVLLIQDEQITLMMVG